MQKQGGRWGQLWAVKAAQGLAGGFLAGKGGERSTDKHRQLRLLLMCKEHQAGCVCVHECLEACEVWVVCTARQMLQIYSTGA